MSPNIKCLQVRSASSASNDAQFILAAWDSTLPYLASIGAGKMWGSEPFSEREGQQQEIEDIIRISEEDLQNDNRRFLVAELDNAAEGKPPIPVGAAMIRDVLPYYLLEREELKGEIEKAKSFLFVEVLISDHRVEPRYRGIGPALTEALKSRALKKGKDAMYVDVYSGNERKLNRYYENLGFQNVGDFSLKRRNGTTWLGTLYCIDLAAVHVD